MTTSRSTATEGEPLEFDPFGPVFFQDPTDVYRRLRNERPVYFNEKYGFWALSRWEDVAAAYLVEHPEIKDKLEEKKKQDSVFASKPSTQLYFVYKNSPYYEPAHMRYPVYRLL